MNTLHKFFVVGAQKAGTTTIHDILKKHNDIILPNVKETKFFLYDKIYKKGYDYYVEKFYENTSNGKVLGEVDPDYLYFEHVPYRIKRILGVNIKIFIILRDPVKRAYSHYMMSKKRGYEKNNFYKATSIEEKRINQGLFEKEHYSYIDRGRYVNQVKRYIDCFGEENVFVYLFEDVIKDNFIGIVNDICHNVGVLPYSEIERMKSNSASIAKSEVLNRFINNVYYDRILYSHLLKKIYRGVFRSKSIRSKILSAIDHINQKKIINNFSDSEKKHYYEKFFVEEVMSLEKICKVKCNQWNDGYNS